MLRPTVRRASAVITTLLCAAAGVLAITPQASAAVTVHEGALTMAWSTNCDSVIWGYPYREISAASVASVMYDDADRPQVGETFYVKVEASALGNPYPCADQKMLPDLTLPAGVSLAVSSATPIHCTKVDYNADPYTITPETALCPAAAGAPESGGSVGLWTSGGNFWTIPTGIGYEIHVPLVASTPGLVAVKFPVRVIDGNDNPILSPMTPSLHVDPAPTTPTTSTPATPAPTTSTPSTTTAPTTIPTTGGNTPPTVRAEVARTVRLARTRDAVPAQVTVNPRGSTVRLVVQARLAGRWVRVARAGYTAAGESDQRIKVRLTSRSRARVPGSPVKARLTVTATTPEGITVRDTASFRMVG